MRKRTAMGLQRRRQVLKRRLWIGLLGAFVLVMALGGVYAFVAGGPLTFSGMARVTPDAIRPLLPEPRSILDESQLNAGDDNDEDNNPVVTEDDNDEDNNPVVTEDDINEDNNPVVTEDDINEDNNANDYNGYENNY